MFAAFSFNERQMMKAHAESRQLCVANHGSDCTVLTATGLVNGEWQISTPTELKPAEPIDIKFGTGDYVRGTTPCAKFGANPFTGGFCANR